jgi:hypothetical protein
MKRVQIFTRFPSMAAIICSNDGMFIIVHALT